MDLLDNWRAWPRASLGLIHLRGADTVAFLQGQLSNDLSLLDPGKPQLAGYHNPQGRAIALLWLLQRAPDDILALLPAELATPVATRLSRFILRSKVRVNALAATAPEGAAMLDTVVAGTAPATAVEPAPINDWRLAGIAAGMPQVHAATSEAFVAQMLNLDLAGGVSFEKGCYTGQEVIARAHYRGKVKRRMQRFITGAAAALAPGDAGVLADGRTFKVVEAAQHPDGRCEFLAVAALEAGAHHEPEAGAEGPAAPNAPVLAVQTLPLPYALPE